MFAALKQLSQLVVTAFEDTTQPISTDDDAVVQSTSNNQTANVDNTIKQSISSTSSLPTSLTSTSKSPSSTSSANSVTTSSSSLLAASSTSVQSSQSSVEQSENAVISTTTSSHPSSVQISKPVQSTITHSPLPAEDGIPWINQLHIRQCFIYPIDPKSHDLNALFAESFPLDKPIATGKLLLFVKNDWLYIRLFDEQGEIFADSVWIDSGFINRPFPLSHYIQPVKDSSRYFALRVGEAGPKPKRVAHLLIGFHERSSAFDLIATINDRIKLSQRLELTERLESDTQSEAEAEARLNETHTDMSLHGSIHVKLHLKTNDHTDPSNSDNHHKRVTSIAVIQSDSGMMLAPPPDASSQNEHEHDQPVVEIEHQNKTKKKKNRKPKSDSNDENISSEDVKTGIESSTAVSDNEDDWGDFAGA